MVPKKRILASNVQFLPDRGEISFGYGQEMKADKILLIEAIRECRCVGTLALIQRFCV